MSYETEQKAHAARRAKILAMLQRKGASIVARTFKVSRQRIYQIRNEEAARKNGARVNERNDA